MEIEIKAGNRAVKITDSEWGLELKTMKNGHQWSSMPVDGRLLGMISLAIAQHENNTAGDNGSEVEVIDNDRVKNGGSHD